MSEAAVEIRKAAEAYCAAIEAGPKTGSDFLDVARLLAGLYYAAASLPLVSPATDDDGATVDASTIARRLRDALGDADEYRMEWIDDATGSEIVHASLSDDLADVYKDVKEVLARPSEPDAICGLRLSFTTHWGVHAAHALAALHARFRYDARP